MHGNIAVAFVFLNKCLIDQSIDQLSFDLSILINRF